MGIAFDVPVAPGIADPAALLRGLDPLQVRRPLAGFLGLEPCDTAVTVERTHFSATRPTTSQYRVSTPGNATDTVILAEFVGSNAESHVAAEAARLSKSRRSQIAKGEPAPLLADLDLGMVFRRPGLDAKLPGLKLLYDPASAVEAAAEAIGSSTRGLSVTATLRAHRLGKRAVVQLDLHGARAGRIFVRLRPTSSTSGASAYTRHQEITAALTDVAGITVPQPLRHDADLGAAFFAALPGKAPIFEGAAGTNAAEAVARALTSIIAHGPEAGTPYTVADELAMLGGWSDRVCTVFPALAGPVGKALAAVEAALFRFEVVRPRPCHRDFHEGQILIHEGCAGVLDFDTYRLADPALDIGNLIAHLRMRGLCENRSLGRIEDTFRRSMLSYGKQQNVEAWTRAAVLRLGCIYAFTSQGSKLARALFREAAE